VAENGKLDLAELEDGSVTLEGTGTIEVDGTLRLPAPDADNYEVEQIVYNDSSIKINAGGSVYMVSTDAPDDEDYYIGPSDAKYEWGTGTPSIELKAGGEMVLTGNLTSAADNALNTKVTITDDSILTVAEDTTLTLGASGKLEIAGTVRVAAADEGDGGILDLAMYQTAANNQGSVTLMGEGKIEVEAGGTVRALQPATGQIDWGDGSIVFYNGSTLIIKTTTASAPYLATTATTGPENSIPVSFSWDTEQDAKIEKPRVTLSKGLMTVDAYLTSNALPSSPFTTNWIDDEAIIASGKVLLVSDTASITVKKDAELAVNGTMAIEKTVSKLILEPGGKVSSTNTTSSPFVGWAGSSIINDASKVTVTVSDGKTATKATLTTAETTHTLATHATAWSTVDPSSTNISLVLGTFKIDSVPSWCKVVT
jgi:hypothetical protein